MLESLIASAVIVLVALTGVFFFGAREHKKHSHNYILPVAVGVFLGVVFLELIPETIELSPEYGPMVIIVGYLAFYLLSYFLHTFHHHGETEDCCEGDGPDATTLLIGDAIHNVADGIIITTAFFVDPTLGIAATIGVLLHEIPQEIVEFGVLIEAGYTKKKAMILNLLSASSIFIGVFVAAFFLEFAADWLFVLLGLAAGNLLYIATTDLLPELQESHRDHFYRTFAATALGALLIGVLIHFTHG